MAKRYHSGNQNSYIKEEQTTQWPKDTTGVIRIRISKKNRIQWPKYTKRVIKIRISKTNRQHNDQKKKDKRTNNDLQNIHIKLKSNTNPTENRCELRCSGRASSSYSTSGIRLVNRVTNPVISHE